MIPFLKRHIYRMMQAIRVKHFCKKHHIVSMSNTISLQSHYAKGVRIGKDVWIDDDVSVGDYTYFNRNASAEHCTIGKYCSISEGVKINPVNHNLKLVSTHPVLGNNGHFGIENEKVTIGNDVLISLNAIILSGVTIGNGAVIGAGAVVTHDVPPYAIAAGVPAKIIGYRFEAEKIETLQQLQWWNWSEEKIQKNMAFLRAQTDKVEE